MSSHSSKKTTWHHNNNNNNNNNNTITKNNSKFNSIRASHQAAAATAAVAAASLAYYDPKYLHPLATGSSNIVGPRGFLGGPGAVVAASSSGGGGGGGVLNRGRSLRGGHRGGAHFRPRSLSAHGSRTVQQQPQKWSHLKPRPATPIRLNYEPSKAPPTFVNKLQVPKNNNSSNSKTIKAVVPPPVPLIGKGGVLVKAPPPHPLIAPVAVGGGGANKGVANKRPAHQYKVPPPVSVDEDVPEFTEEQHICQLHNDTLDKCFGESGTYVCKSYGPRSFIFQKVLDNHHYNLHVQV